MGERRDDLAQALVELQAVQRVAEDVISSRDLDDVLARCIDHTREMAGTTSGAIYLRDERRGVFQRLIARETVNDQAHLPIEQIDAALTGRNYFVADMHDPLIAWHPAVQLARERGFRIVLNLGMRWRGQLTGLLILAWRDEVKIPESTLRTLEALMSYLAAAIENAHTRMLLETRARLAHALLEFSGRALTTTDEAALQQLILDTACSLARGDGGVVAVRVDDRFRLVAGRNSGGPEYLPASDSLIAAAIAQRAPFLLDKIDDAFADSQIILAARAGGYSSIALMPLQHGAAATGLLIVGLSEPHQWNSEEAEALQTLAQVSSEALERCRVQLAEARERRRIDATLEHLPIGVVVIDGEGHMLHNNRASTALGTLLGAIAGNYQAGMQKLRTSDGTPVQFEESLIGRALRGELTQPRDIDLIDTNGRRRVIRAVAAPLHEPGQPPVAVLGFSEVTELVELAAAKDRFLRIASHELRSPVTALRATAQLLSLDPTVATDEARRALLHDRIDRQSERLSKLVAQLLDSARLSAGAALPLELEDFDLGKLAREMADDAGPRVRLTSDGELRGRWDRARLEQVMSNLLANALQYSPADTPVELVLAADAATVRLEVRDRGAGIAADEVEQVFAPFYRSAHSSGQHKGMGLGLHITSEIVQRHGGTIRVVSEPGVGSTFFVELPRGLEKS